jgi:autotransporter-associated beta strand protein
MTPTTAVTTLDLNGKNETINGLTVGPGSGAKITNTAAAANSVLTIGAGDTTSAFSGTITDSGTNRTLAITKTGTGTLTLSGTSNNYVGATTVSGGTLALGASNVLPDTSAVSLGSATLDAVTFSDTAGTLDVTAAGTIALGSGTLAFADSSAVDWSGGTLNITGTLGATSLRFGTTSGGLTPTQLGLINVNGAPGTYTLDAGGYLIAGGYGAWSGGAAFDADSNGDGVSNGLAWLLGAANKDVSALGKLPVVTQSGGNLVLTFDCLNATNRGAAVLKVQYSRDLGSTDLWATHDSAVVPGTAPTTVTVGGVDYVTTANGDLIHVVATIPASAAAPGTKLFGRLKGIQP